MPAISMDQPKTNGVSKKQNAKVDKKPLEDGMGKKNGAVDRVEEDRKPKTVAAPGLVKKGGKKTAESPPVYYTSPRRESLRSVTASLEGSRPTEKSLVVEDVETEIEDGSDEEFQSEIEHNPNKFQLCILNVQDAVAAFFERHRKILKLVFCIAVALAWHCYFIAAMVRNGWRLKDTNFGLEGLIVLTVLAWVVALFELVYKPYLHERIVRVICTPISKLLARMSRYKWVRWLVCLTIAVAIMIFIIVDTWNDSKRLISLVGLAVFMLLGFLFSKNSTRIKWRPVLSALLLQFCMAVVIFRSQTGLDVFEWLSNVIMKFLKHTEEGTKFVYGFLSEPPNICGLRPVLLFSVFQVVLYFGAMANVLYYFGAIQWILLRFATCMRVLVGTTAAESLIAVACTVFGQSEAPLLIKPYLGKMTKSELHQVIVSGYASIAGSLFAAYVAFGACSHYLLAASIMSAPMSICVAKLFYPEIEKSKTRRVRDLKLPKSKDASFVEALANGAYGVVPILSVIAANLVVFIAVIHFVNATIGWMGRMVDIEGLSLELIYSYLFFPLAFLMGPSDRNDWAGIVDETMLVAELLGTKTVLNEFMAYKRMSELVSAGRLGKRAQMIATYALCSFANIGSIGIQIGALGELCPEKKDVLPKLAVRALLAGSVSSLMTACFAGLLVNDVKVCNATMSNSNCFDTSMVCRCYNQTNETSFEEGAWFNETSLLLV